MPLHKLPPSTPSADLRPQWRYTVALLNLDPRSRPLSAAFGGFGPAWKQAADERASLDDAVSDAGAGVDFGDAGLDDLVDQVDAILYAAAGKDRSAPQYEAVFGGLSLSELKRPTLGAQLETMRLWPQRLIATGIDALVALAPQVAQAVLDADAAAKALTDADEAVRRFETQGAGSKQVGQLNALRKDAHDALLKLGTADWADRFFPNDSRAHSSSALPALQAQLAQLQVKVQKKSAQVAAAQAQAAADAKAQADKLDLKRQSADADKAAKEAVAKAKALKAQAKKK